MKPPKKMDRRQGMLDVADMLDGAAKGQLAGARESKAGTWQRPWNLGKAEAYRVAARAVRAAVHKRDTECRRCGGDGVVPIDVGTCRICPLCHGDGAPRRRRCEAHVSPALAHSHRCRALAHAWLLVRAATYWLGWRWEYLGPRTAPLSPRCSAYLYAVGRYGAGPR